MECLPEYVPACLKEDWYLKDPETIPNHRVSFWRVFVSARSRLSVIWLANPVAVPTSCPAGSVEQLTEGVVGRLAGAREVDLLSTVAGP